MRVIVTGGAGFIGSCLLRKLNDEGMDDILVVDHLSTSEKWKNLVGKRFQDYIEKDRFLGALEAGRFKGAVECIVHLGACTSTLEQNASYIMENNYEYSRRLAQWALKNAVHFLYASSAATYGSGETGYSDDDRAAGALRPLNLYGYSKHLFDLWLIRNRLSKKVTGFKFFNVFGPNEYHKGEMRSVVAKSFNRLKSGQSIQLFKSYRREYADGEQKRDFIYVKDILDVILFFLQHPDRKGIMNVGTGEARSWNDLARALFSAMSRKPAIEYIEMPDAIREKYQHFTQADIAKLRKAGYKRGFANLEEAIKDYLDYLSCGTYL